MASNLCLAVAAAVLLCAGASPVNNTATTAIEGSGWVQFQHLNFYFSSEKLSWFDAKQFCYNSGATLARPYTILIHDFLVGQLRNRNMNEVWTDFNDINEESNFVSTTGVSPSFNDWMSNQPDDAGPGEDCMGYWFMADSHTWNDFVCDWTLQFICEKGQ